MAAKIEIYPSGKSAPHQAQWDEFRWHLRAANGQIVATGHQSFVSRFNARRAATQAANLMDVCLVYRAGVMVLRPEHVRQL